MAGYGAGNIYRVDPLPQQGVKNATLPAVPPDAPPIQSLYPWSVWLSWQPAELIALEAVAVPPPTAGDVPPVQGPDYRGAEAMAVSAWPLVNEPRLSQPNFDRRYALIATFPAPQSQPIPVGPLILRALYAIQQTWPRDVRLPQLSQEWLTPFTAPPPTAAILSAVSTLTQGGIPGLNALFVPQVQVTSALGAPVQGTLVIFSITGGGGSLTGNTQLTSTAGIATLGSWTFGPSAGTNTVQAASSGLNGSPVTFTAVTAVPTAPKVLTRTLGFQQTDAASVYTGAGLTDRVANSSTLDRLCAIIPGVAVNSVTLDANAKDLYALSFDIPVPPFTVWNAGDWTVRLNVRQANASVTWNRCYIIAVNSAGQFQKLLGVRFPIASVLTTPGVKEVRVRCDGVDTRQYFDRVVVVCCFTAQGTVPPANLQVATGPQTFSFVSDQVIDSPFTG